MTTLQKINALENLLITNNLRNELWLLCFTDKFYDLIGDKFALKDLFLVTKWIYTNCYVSEEFLGKIYDVIEREMDKQERQFVLEQRSEMVKIRRTRF